jgi:hypothetical protein
MDLKQISEEFCSTRMNSDIFDEVLNRLKSFYECYGWEGLVAVFC